MSAILSFVLTLDFLKKEYKQCPYSDVGRLIFTYETYARFYEHYGVISNQTNYAVQIKLYRDSLLTILDPASYQFKINMANRYILLRETDKAEGLLSHLLRVIKVDSPEYAVVTHCLGVLYGIKRDYELEKKYYTMSAIADVKNVIKENASFQHLALIYYDDGDIAKAVQYSQAAIEDAVFSGVQFRSAQMFRFYSIINGAYQIKESATNRALKKSLGLISILSFSLILLLAYIYKQIKKLSCIKEELSNTNNKLIALNNALNETNALMNQRNNQLSEANLVKEQYIARFFNLCSTYIDKMGEYRKVLYKLAINKQYEELFKNLKSTSVVDQELEELYTHFDSIFLSLYPTFISDFNSLLSDEEQVTLKNKNLLNKELRIYALLRLGITDSAKIAAFLRCSMSTIYNYRTKMRNKAALNRERFEEMVMKINTIKSGIK